jgi:hypothetical protein
MNDEQLIWEAYQTQNYPIISMIDPTKISFTEKDQEKEKIEQIKKSYGYDYNLIEWEEQPKPIVSVDEDGDMKVEDGHHRISAFKELNYPKIPAILVSNKIFNILKNKYGLHKASIIIADQLKDEYTLSHLYNS